MPKLSKCVSEEFKVFKWKKCAVCKKRQSWNGATRCWNCNYVFPIKMKINDMRGKKNKVCARKSCSVMQRSNNAKKCYVCGNNEFVRYNISGIVGGGLKKKKNQSRIARKNVRKMRENVSVIEPINIFQNDLLKIDSIDALDVFWGTRHISKDVMDTFIEMLESCAQKKSMSVEI